MKYRFLFSIIILSSLAHDSLSADFTPFFFKHSEVLNELFETPANLLTNTFILRDAYDDFLAECAALPIPRNLFREYVPYFFGIIVGLDVLNTIFTQLWQLRPIEQTPDYVKVTNTMGFE